MEIKDAQNQGGSLQISSEVIEKIARMAALEVDGVQHVSVGTDANKSFIGKLAPQKAVHVDPKDDVADIEISLVVTYGAKIPALSEQVQKNVKQAVQNMTSIIVGRVDVVVTGVTPNGDAPPAAAD